MSNKQKQIAPQAKLKPISFVFGFQNATQMLSPTKKAIIVGAM